MSWTLSSYGLEFGASVTQLPGLTYTATEGNGLILMVSVTRAATLTWSDTLGNISALATGLALTNLTTSIYFGVYYISSEANSGSNTITLAFDASTSGQLHASEWNPGTGNVLGFDSVNSAHGSGSAISVTSNVPAESSELALFVPQVAASISLTSLASGWTKVTGTNGSAHTTWVASQTTGAAALTGSITSSSGSANWGASIALFYPSVIGTNIVPNVGADSISGNSPTVTPANNSVLIPAVARFRGNTYARHRDSGLLIPESRKIFLPSRKAA